MKNIRFIKGADVSFYDEIEQNGGRFYVCSHEKDLFKILKEYGVNTLRFRIWNDPDVGYCSPERTLVMVKRAVESGFEVGLDFHYSDWWADPGKQYKPKKWANLHGESLGEAVYDFTRSTLLSFKSEGIAPVFVQIGNEVTRGMLWEDGKVPSRNEPDNPDAWSRFSYLLSCGIRAVRDVFENDTKVMIHIDRGGDNPGAIFFLEHIMSHGVEFDWIGLSYYPWWHGPICNFRDNVMDLSSRYGRPILLAETAYPWREVTLEQDGIKLHGTAKEQRDFLEEVFSIIKDLPCGLGLGVLYWEPDAIPLTQTTNGWSAFAMFDEQGRALCSMEIFDI
ncbi:glycoside hydrolase family 53 protein [Alicyclobacillus sendaiensis]|uniref:glycoside hydrolase family 53 protein n=1 Tax=Alicyclobacillus sendaiensis TaxID=192387 RepID=UPI000AF6008A|nr:glycosyl hydrolase 53 family protein [Alicyclobacillus sendaiensis]